MYPPEPEGYRPGAATRTGFRDSLGRGDAELIVDRVGATMPNAMHVGATWDRLASIKSRYDPTNLFRLNQNVPPA
jgi:FAD/FMN-containing dehydrogenase